MVPALNMEDVATRLGVDRSTIRYWIANRELAAVNVSKTKSTKRPSWRFTEEALAAFEMRRQTITSAPKAATRRDKFKTTRNWSDEI